ncbi:MAG: hypothetical protein QG671_571 [Actinomycetota bacterium]|nr:hypothetical protein [Actinomycetota bacterium]
MGDPCRLAMDGAPGGYRSRLKCALGSRTASIVNRLPLGLPVGNRNRVYARGYSEFRLPVSNHLAALANAARTRSEAGRRRANAVGRRSEATAHVSAGSCWVRTRLG